MTLRVIEPLTMLIDEPCDTTGPATTSNPSNDGASNDSPSGLALSVNSTRNISPTATVSGELATKVTFSAPKAEKIASTKSAVKDIFATKSLIDYAIKSSFRFYNVNFRPLVCLSAGPGRQCLKSAKKSLPLSSTMMNAGKFST